MKPRLLDLFCGAGGAAYGYHLAGFEVVGVDHLPQPHYPFEFCEADAFEYLAEHGHEFEAIHASPPCQRYSHATPPERRELHSDLIAVTRAAIWLTGLHYVIENVAGARGYLINPVMLCGSMFGLPIWRHRYFECGFPVGLTPPCDHSFIPILVTGTTTRKGCRRVDATVAEKRVAMGIDWMSTKELDQAIPPAYSEWLGSQLMGVLRGR